MHPPSEPVLTEIKGSVLVVTINRPPANAIDAPTSRRLGDIFSRFRDDRDLRVAILMGGGSRFFCAGWDLKAAHAGEGVEADFGVGGFGGVWVPNLDKPIIAAINGIAAGGGFEIALAADMIICADTARLAIPGVTVCVLPEVASVLLRRRIPHYVAMELLLTGRWFTPQEALQWGCCNYIVPQEALMLKAMEVADQMVRGAPLVQKSVKQATRATEMLTLESALELVQSHKLSSIAELYASDDSKEGIRAFVEKRAPKWSGA